MHFVDDHRFSIHRARVTQGVNCFGRRTQGFLFTHKSAESRVLRKSRAQVRGAHLLTGLFLLVNLRVRRGGRRRKRWVQRRFQVRQSDARKLKTDAAAQQFALKRDFVWNRKGPNFAPNCCESRVKHPFQRISRIQ